MPDLDGVQGGMIAKSLTLPFVLSLKEKWHAAPVRYWRELAALALFLLGLSWGIPWFRALTAATREVSQGRVFWTFAAIGLTAYLLVRTMVGFQLAQRLRRQLLIGVAVAATAFGLRTILYAKEMISLAELVARPLRALANFHELIPNEIIVIVTVLLVYRRAAVLALDYIGPGRVQSEFKTGFAMFLVFSLVISTMTGEQIADEQMLLFLFSGLAGMGAARMDSIGELRGGLRTRLAGRRGAAMLLGVSLTAITAYQVGLAFGSDGAVLAGFVLGAVVLAVFLVSIPLLLVVLYLLYFIVSLFEGEISLALERLLEAIQDLLAFFDSLRNLLQIAGTILAEKFAFLAPVFRAMMGAAPAVRIMALIAVVLLPLILVLAVLAIRLRATGDRGLSEEDGSLDLRSLLRRLRAGLRGRLEKRSPGFVMSGSDRRQLILAARIRRMYVRLIRLAAELGYPKGAAQTPDEFSTELLELFPTEAEAIGEMTRAYERIRYGELPEESAEVTSVSRAWARIKLAARSRKGAARYRTATGSWAAKHSRESIGRR